MRAREKERLESSLSTATERNRITHNLNHAFTPPYIRHLLRLGLAWTCSTVGSPRQLNCICAGSLCVFLFSAFSFIPPSPFLYNPLNEAWPLLSVQRSSYYSCSCCFFCRIVAEGNAPCQKSSHEKSERTNKKWATTSLDGGLVGNGLGLERLLFGDGEKVAKGEKEKKFACQFHPLTSK